MPFERSPLKKFAKELKGKFVIGHSGHRNILPSDKTKILNLLKVKIIQLRHKNSKPCILISPIADGADELAIQAAFDSGIQVAILWSTPLEQQKLAALISRQGNNILNFQMSGNGDQLYTNQADLIIKYSLEILLLWDGIQNDKTGGPSYIFRQLYYKATKPKCLHQLVIPRADSPFPVRAIGMHTEHNFIGHPELNWYENFCTDPKGIKFSGPTQVNSKESFSLVSWWNKYESFILQFIAPALLLLTTIILGYIGFENYQICLNKNNKAAPLLDFLDYAFKAINLATLNSSVIGDSGNCNNLTLNIARISGVIFLIYAFILAFIKLTGSNLNRFWILSWRIKFLIQKLLHLISGTKTDRNGPYDTLIGLSEQSHYLAMNLLQHGHKVIIISDDEPSTYKTTCQLAGAVIYSDKPSLKRVFEKSKIQNSDSIYIFSQDDTQNARTLQHADRYLSEKGKNHKPKLFVHVNDIRERYFLDNTTTIPAETFQINENISRKLLREHPLDRPYYQYYQSQRIQVKKVQVIIIGFGALGQTLALHIAGNGHYHKDLPLSIKVYYEAKEDAAVKNFTAQYPCFYKNSPGYQQANCASEIQQEVFLPNNSAALIEFEPLPIAENILLHDGFSIYDYIKTQHIVNIYTCIENALLSASLTNDILPYLNYLKVNQNCNLQVFCFCNLPDLQEIASIEEKLNKSANDIPVNCFGNYIEACSYSAIHQNHLDDFSKRLALWYHFLYEKGYNLLQLKQHWGNEKIESLDQQANELWETQTESIKDANRAAADHIFIKLRSAKIENSDKLTDVATKLHNIESDLSQMEHTRWCAQKLIEGFQPLMDSANGTAAEAEWINDSKKKKTYQSIKLHLNLKPFNQLSLNEKNKDHSQIEGIPYILNLQR